MKIAKSFGVMAPGLLGALLGVAVSSSAATAQSVTREMRERNQVALGPIITWSMSVRCGHDVPEKLKIEATLMAKGAFGDETIEMIELVSGSVEKMYAELNSRQKRQFCAEALAKVAEYEDRAQ